MVAIVLCGGLGTRLASKLKGIPKAMAPVCGKPFLDIILRRLEACGFTKVILAVCYHENAIREFFGYRWGSLKLEYSCEDYPLGTGGAIRKALQSVNDEVALVINGDTFIYGNLALMVLTHLSHKCDLTVAVSSVKLAGAYVITRTFPWPENLPVRFSFEEVLARNEFSYDPFRVEGFLDIGTPEDYERAQVELEGK